VSGSASGEGSTWQDSTSWLGGGVARALEALLRRECDRPPRALGVALVGARNRSVLTGKLGTVRLHARGVEFRGIAISELDAEASGVSLGGGRNGRAGGGGFLAAPFDLHAAVRVSQADLTRTLGLEDVSRAVLAGFGRAWRPGDVVAAQLLSDDRLRLSGWCSTASSGEEDPFPASIDARLAIGPSPSTLRLHALPGQDARVGVARDLGAAPPYADAYPVRTLPNAYVDFDLGAGTRLHSLAVDRDALRLTAVFTVTP